MGCISVRERKYVNAKTTADFVGNALEYGVFLVSVEISYSAQWSKEKKEWFQKSRQVILTFCGVSAVAVLPEKSSSLQFNFRIPFSKEGFKVFQKPFILEYDYNNFYSGFQGVIETSKIISSFLVPIKEETKISFLGKEEIPIFVSYVLIGSQLLADLKQFTLEGIEVEKQKEILVQAFKFYDKEKEDQNILNPEHGVAIQCFFGGNTQEKLINGFLKYKYEEFRWYMSKACEIYYKEANENEDEKLDISDKIPIFPTNFETIFELEGSIYSCELVTKYAYKGNKLIFQSVPFFKKIVQMWLTDELTNGNCKDYYFLDPKKTSQTLTKIYQQDQTWFYDVLLKRVFQLKDPISIKVLVFFMQKYPETREYLRNVESKIDFDALEGLQVGPFLKNYIYTPDFINIRLKMLKFYGHTPTNRDPISNVFNEYPLGFTSNPGEISNITVIGEEQEGKPFVVTHFFLKSQPQNYNASIVYTAVYFLPSEMPSQESIKKFYGLTQSRFEQNDYPEDDILKPLAFIDREGKSEAYEEVRLSKPLVGKIFVCIFLKAKEVLKNMDIGTTGCLGFMGDEPDKFDGLRLDGGGKRVFKPEG